MDKIFVPFSDQLAKMFPNFSKNKNDFNFNLNILDLVRARLQQKDVDCSLLAALRATAVAAEREVLVLW